MSAFFEPLESRTMYSATVSVASLDPNANEHGQDTASFFVYRQERLATPTRVFFTVGGTAASPLNAFPASTADYTGISAPPLVIGTFAAATSSSATASTRLSTAITSGALLPIFGGTTAYVDIPAGQTYAVVTIKPNDDLRIESPETAVFTLQTNAGYTVANPSSVTLTIHDNDGPVVLHDSNDAYLRDGTYANSNFGHAADLEVKNGPAGFRRAALLQFDISSIDPGNGFGRISLKLFGSLNNANQKNVVTSVIPYGNDSWSETAVTWNHHPEVLFRGPAPVLGTMTVIDNTPRWYTVDVTDYVESQLRAGKTSITLLLTNNDVSDPYVKFNSREAGTNVPQLVFTAS